MESTRIHEGIPLYYLTFTVAHWLPVFIAAEPCLTITESLNYCHRHEHLRINAYVVMPTHLHLILFDVDFDNRRLEETISSFRQFTGRQLIAYCQQKMPAVYEQVIGAPHHRDRENNFWQQGKHPVAISSEPFWQTKVAYLHDNPCRKGLVREPTAWRFSSAAYWHLDPPGETDVELTGVQW